MLFGLVCFGVFFWVCLSCWDLPNHWCPQPAARSSDAMRKRDLAILMLAAFAIFFSLQVSKLWNQLPLCFNMFPWSCFFFFFLTSYFFSRELSNKFRYTSGFFRVFWCHGSFWLVTDCLWSRWWWFWQTCMRVTFITALILVVSVFFLLELIDWFYLQSLFFFLEEIPLPSHGYDFRVFVSVLWFLTRFKLLATHSNDVVRFVQGWVESF